MAEDLLTKIEEAMKNAILSMEQGLYHFNWLSCNEEDMAKSSFPVANIYLEDETSLDDPDGPSNNMYFQEVLFRIEVLVKLEEEYSQPRFAINEQLNLALSDLKRLFGSDYSINGTVDTIMYKDSSREYIQRNDIFLPTKLITHWVVKYEQDRTDPDVIA